MSAIRYVCLSDMHMGEEDSLMTNLTPSHEVDPHNPSPVMVHLVECLKDLLSKANDGTEKPTLILDGDILELALAYTNEAAMVFQQFVKLVMPQDNELFEKIIYIPGNHDHHIWEVAREMQYADYIERGGSLNNIPWHTTNMFVENARNPVPAYFLTRVVQKLQHLKDAGFGITIAYPNFGVFNEQKRCVIFHHGHLISSHYRMMSKLMTWLLEHDSPETIEGIETENFAWIDFIWSLLLRSGKSGEKIQLIWKKIRDEEAHDELTSVLADRLADVTNIPHVASWLEDDVYRWTLRKMIDIFSGERGQPVALSADSRRELRAYMEGPVKAQIRGENEMSFLEEDDMPFLEEGEMPSETTFIFGHTHKPIEEDMEFSGYNGLVNVYNTGGWVVEKEAVEPYRGGAIVLVDEELNTTSLRMYNEAARAEDYSVTVNEAMYSSGTPNVFCQQIRDLVEQSPGPWERFSACVAREVHIRAMHAATYKDKKI